MHDWNCPRKKPGDMEIWRVIYPAPDFKKCPTCGLEWRGAETCPQCEADEVAVDKVLVEMDAERLEAERDQARDWCRKLVALLRICDEEFDWVDLLCTDTTCACGPCTAYRALPPELRAVLEA